MPIHDPNAIANSVGVFPAVFALIRAKLTRKK